MVLVGIGIQDREGIVVVAGVELICMSYKSLTIPVGGSHDVTWCGLGMRSFSLFSGLGMSYSLAWV